MSLWERIPWVAGSASERLADAAFLRLLDPPYGSTFKLVRVAVVGMDTRDHQPVVVDPFDNMRVVRDVDVHFHDEACLYMGGTESRQASHCRGAMAILRDRDLI